MRVHPRLAGSVALISALAAAACSDEPIALGDTGDTGDTGETGEPGTDTETGPDPDTETDTDPALPDLPPPDLPPEMIECAPVAGGPFWLLEGETVEFQITCSTGLELPGDEFAITPLPSNASYDPATATVSWTPTLTQAAVYHLDIEALPFAEHGSVKIGVADDFEHPNNVPVVDPLAYTEEYGLPVLFLDNDLGLNDDFYTPAAVTYAGELYTAESKLRGASSLNYPKNSYTLKFAKDHKFTEPERAGGFLEKRKIVLTTTFDDNSYLRQRLAFELWNRLDPEHIQVQAYNAVVFVDRQYWGLYMIGDHIDGYLMEDHGLWQDGNLYKARTHDANFRLTKNDGNPKLTLHDGYTKSEGLPLEGDPGAFDDLDALVAFVATADDVDFVAELDTRIDQRDYEDWWIFVSAISARDSGGKNTYHYHDPNGGPWRLIPWDFNHSFGQNWYTARMDAYEVPESYRGRNELFGRMLDAPSIGPGLRQRYMAVLDDQYALEELLGLVDEWEQENLDCALRDVARWGDDYLGYGAWNWRTDFLTHEQEVDYVRDWLTERWAYLATLY